MKSVRTLFGCGLLSVIMAGFAFPQAIEVSLPDTLTAKPGTAATIPILVGELAGRNIISYQTVISFDENVLNATGASSIGTLSESFGPPTVNVSQDGQIIIGGFGPTPLSGSGILVKLAFDVMGQPGDTTELKFVNFIFNAGNPLVNIQNGKFTVAGALPVANANGPYFGTVGSPVQFNGSGSSDSDGTIVSYAWDFGDGFVGTGPNPAHVYSSSGNFVVMLTVMDNDNLTDSDTTRAEIGTTGVHDVAFPPNVFALKQNFPNPFNPETVIGFDLPAEWSKPATLQIFNVQGHLVRTLVDKMVLRGVHAIVWDGKDASGKSMPTGLYFYKLASGNFVAVRNMLLAK